MNERNLVHLFTDLREVLNGFVTTYRTDHPNLLAIETQCLDKLRTIVDELNFLLKDQLSTEKFTLNKYEIFLLRIVSIKPPAEIVKKQKSNGFFGIGASESEEKIPVPLTNAITDLLKTLKEKQEAEEKQIASEKKFQSGKSSKLEQADKVPEKIGSSSNKMEIMEAHLLKLTQRFEEYEKRIEASEKQIKESQKMIEQAYENGNKEGYESGKKDERGRLMIGFRDALKCLGYHPDQQQQIFLLLENGEPKASESGIPVTPAVFKNITNVVPTEPKIKSEDDEEKKAKDWIGDVKFPVVKKLVDLHNLSHVSKVEQLVAKWVIFELMFHKYDKRISEVFADIKKLLPTLSSVRLNNLFETYANYNQDSISNKKLSPDEYKTFHQLTKNEGLYLPFDGTATNCFGTYYKNLKEGETGYTTEDMYGKNVLEKITKELKKENQNVFHKVETELKSSGENVSNNDPVKVVTTSTIGLNC